jgi:hypothetical protein
MPEFHGRFSSPIAELCAEINDGNSDRFNFSFSSDEKGWWLLVSDL